MAKAITWPAQRATWARVPQHRRQTGTQGMSPRLSGDESPSWGPGGGSVSLGTGPAEGTVPLPVLGPRLPTLSFPPPFSSPAVGPMSEGLAPSALPRAS